MTGVSTGALIAPFAFLGGRYYDRLRTMYTTIKASDILEKRGSWRRLWRGPRGYDAFVSAHFALLR